MKFTKKTVPFKIFITKYIVRKTVSEAMGSKRTSGKNEKTKKWPPNGISKKRMGSWL